MTDFNINREHQTIDGVKTYISISTIHKRGIFAKSKINSGDIIEFCPVIEIPTDHIQQLRQTALINYYFMWGSDLNAGAVALGYGSIYNHSYEPNANFRIIIKEQIIEITAIRNIEKDDEITINYNGDPNDRDLLGEHYMITK